MKNMDHIQAQKQLKECKSDLHLSFSQTWQHEVTKKSINFKTNKKPQITDIPKLCKIVYI